MKKKINKQQRNYNRAKKRREHKRKEEYEKKYTAKIYGEYEKLSKNNIFAESHADLGKLLYSYSDARTWVDLPSEQKFRRIFAVQRVFLLALAALLSIWFFTALIYQLCTAENAGKALLKLLPSFVLIAACVAILLISVFKGWGKLLRWGYKHNLVHGKGALQRMRVEEMKRELERADRRKAIENRIDITPDYVVLSIYGKEQTYRREVIQARVYKNGDGLSLKLKADGEFKEFPVLLPEEEYVPLKKALREQLTAIRINVTDKSELCKKLVKEIPALFMMTLILAAGIMLTVTHYLWLKEIPPFLGVFFIGMSFIALCNILSFIPAVNAVGIPLTFSLVLLVVPPWALIWFNQYIFRNGGNFLQIILKCDPLTAGFSFFTVIGAYVFSFAMFKLVDYIRFGEIK